MPHLATTYAAVNSLITLGGHRSLSSINRWLVFATFKQMVTLYPVSFETDLIVIPIWFFRGKLYTFLLQMKDPCGAYRCDILFLCVI